MGGKKKQLTVTTITATEPSLNFSAALYERIKDNIQEWATGAGSFVVVSLMETGDTGFGQQQDELRKTLGQPQCNKAIRESAKNGVKGSKVIVEKL